MARTRQWPPLGLCCKIEGKEDESVELLKCEAVADIADDDAGVRLTQYFSNPSFGTDKEDQEAVYKFPLIGDVAVYYFKSCYLSEQGEPLKTLFGKAKEKQQAREEYEQAKANGKAAQLLEIDYENSPDLFVMSLGNIPSNCKTVSVELAFYCPLQTEEKGVVKRFTLPSVLTGRYGKFSPSAFTGPNVKNAAALFSFEANICLGNFVSSLESPTHTISSKLMIGGSPSRAQVTFSKAEEPLSKDLVLKISSGTAPKSSLLVQTPESIPNPEFAKDFPDTTLAKLTLNCALEVPEEAEIKKNFIFVVDRSGSMSGASMRNCKKALQLCLASLPEECQFDICSFGSNFDFLFNGTSRDYSEATLNAARDHVEAMTANYGGTEILQPLQKIVEAKSDIPTVVFLLTDGQVYNTSSIVSLIKKEHEKSGTTVFTCGIGSGVDHSLVDGLAKAGGGTATYISYGEKMNAKLAAQMEQAIEPPCTNLKLEFGELRMSPAKLGWNPVSVLPAFVYSGQRIDCYMTLDSTSLLALRKILETEDEVPPIQLLGKITVEGKAETVSIAQVDLRKDMLETDSNLVVPAFRQQIALVEEALKTKKSEKKKAIAFAVAANIVTKYTSLVAVEEGNEGEERQAELEKPRPKVEKHLEKERKVRSFGGMKRKKLKKKRGGAQKMAAPRMLRSSGPVRPTITFDPSSDIGFASLPDPSSSPPPPGFAPPTAPSFNAPMLESARKASLQMEMLEIDDLADAGANFASIKDSEEQEEDDDASSASATSMAGAGMVMQMAPPLPSLGGASRSKPAKSAAIAPVLVTDDDKLAALIGLQKMNGSFELTPAFTAVLGVDSFGDDSGLPGLATALALKFLEKQLAGLQAEWKLMSKKARKWLKKNVKDWENLLQVADKYV